MTLYVPAGADDAAGSEEQAQAQPLWFPAAGGPGESEPGHPGEQLAGQGDDLAPDLVLGVALQGRVRRPVSLAARIWLLKQTLGLDRLHLRNPRAADTRTWLILAAYARLWLATWPPTCAAP